MNRFQVFLPIALCMALIQPALAQTVTGSGTANYVPIWTSSSALGDSRLYQSGNDVGIDTITPQFALDVTGFINSSRGYRIGESLILSIPGGTSLSNLALGYKALVSNPTGDLNTAIGVSALEDTTTGSDNTAIGIAALGSNSTGSGNTATGVEALLENNIGGYNTATGTVALQDNTSGSMNTATGEGALENNTTGSNNIAIGPYAAFSVAAGNSNNIEIGSEGSSTDSGTIRIGTAGTQTTFFAAGIYGVSAGNNDAIPVLIDSTGQLVTLSSSRRYKENIQDMGDASRGLMQLRPVTFRYKKPLADGSQPLQYGLIAEEVAEVYPDLVTHSTDGQIETVKYQVLNSMLLNEVQRQQAEIHALQDRLDRMDAALAALSPAINR